MDDAVSLSRVFLTILSGDEGSSHKLTPCTEQEMSALLNRPVIRTGPSGLSRKCRWRKIPPYRDGRRGSTRVHTQITLYLRLLWRMFPAQTSVPDGFPGRRAAALDPDPVPPLQSPPRRPSRRPNAKVFHAENCSIVPPCCTSCAVSC